jgi:hypothetical protein
VVVVQKLKFLNNSNLINLAGRCFSYRSRYSQGAIMVPIIGGVKLGKSTPDREVPSRGINRLLK